MLPRHDFQSNWPEPSMTDTPKPSPMERIKEESQYLRGSIPEELAEETDHFGKDAQQILKHHGTYQQDDRDQRAAAKAAGRNRAYMLMVRTRIPGGKLTSAQLLAEIDLCDELGNQTLRLTSRQGLQLHGIFKADLQATIARINEIQLTTLAACGDVNRNVMCCPAKYVRPVHEQMQALADQITDHLSPQTRAYHQIWMKELGSDEKQLVAGADPLAVEPIYGQHYLPRKFKIGIAVPDDNCIDVYTHDVGLLAIADGDTITGYNVLVGGGMGVTPSAKKTFPALGKKLCFVPRDHVVDLVTAVVKVQRDFGNRSDRKVARLKYLVANLGIEGMREKVREYFGSDLEAPRAADVTEHNDHIGWEPQGDGHWFYGLHIENGRIKDDGAYRLKTALREICSSIQPGIRLTAHQSILFTDLTDGQREPLTQVLRDHGVALSEEISNIRRWSMACVAWPTCGLSITEAERALPGIIHQLEQEIDRLGLGDEKITLRMTGCPNGCARPYNPDIGIVGKAKGKYTLLLGGSRLGTRLSFIYKDLVPEEDVVGEINAVLRYFQSAREPGEALGDFCYRQGKDDLTAQREKGQAPI
jgi:sulfite reductase (ferredoxin)